jgi:hypothetical protein
MHRARRAGSTALIVVVIAASMIGWGGAGVLAGAVAWPPSTLVVSELQTGGASASDEFVEIANQGAAPVDLLGLEVVYATSSGSTITRKATWPTSTVLGSGKRILLANASGAFAAVADATYSGGFAATGGAVVIRVVGGAAIDVIGWGDATNGFVEGTAAPAPPAGSSLERAPGGAAGNGIDTNDNILDWFVQGVPSPQGLGAPPVPPPGPSPTPTPSATPGPTPMPTPTPTAAPSPTPSTLPPTPAPTPALTPTPTLTPSPTATASPTATPDPTSTPTPTPSPTATASPTATPDPTASPTPTPTPAPSPRPIAEARSLADGVTVTIEGVLTTALGALESGHGGFIQDASGGIALYLDAPVTGAWAAGTTVIVEGSLSSRYSQRTLRVSESSMVAGALAGLPAAVPATTGTGAESLEGVRITVTGAVTGSPDQLADGLGITLDDGSGPIRAVVGPDALAGRTIQSGLLATVEGPLGQRDSSGTGSAGYRIHVTLPGELQLVDPTPSPSPAPIPTESPLPTAAPSGSAPPTPSPTASPVPSPSPTPLPAPSATPSPSVAAAGFKIIRTMPLGNRVRVSGVVTAEAGRLGTPTLLAIGDASGGLVVHLASGSGALDRGALLEVTGVLAAPYGQLEIRPAKADIRSLGPGALPAPVAVGTADLAESLEGRLASVTGRVGAKPRKTAGGDLTFVLDRDGAGPLSVRADVSSRIAAASIKVGASYTVVGVVGQRATRSGALDGYRIWVRDAADLHLNTAAPPSGAPGPSASGSTTPRSAVGAIGTVTISRALRVTDRAVAIDAVVTAPAALLDATGRRIVVQDSSAAIEVLLPAGSVAPPVGTRIHAEGRIGAAYGAPRLRADRFDVAGSRPVPAPIVLHGASGPANEWRLVSITGRVASVHKLGDRWRAELVVGGQNLPVVGQPGARVASTALTEGRTATVTGILRRPYPNASDKRFAVTPRFAADVRVVGPTAASDRAGAAGTNPATTDSGATRPSSTGQPIDLTAVDADLVDLAAFVGRVVRVGGLVVDLTPDGFRLDDGTATGRVILRGAALERLSLVEPDDAINAIGRVEATPDGPVIVVDEPGGIVGSGDPVPASPTPSVSPAVDAGVASSNPATGSRFAGLSNVPWPLDAGVAGIATLVALSAASLAVTLLRREHARRRLATRIAARLASVAGPLAGPPAGGAEASLGLRSAERVSSTRHSA